MAQIWCRQEINLVGASEVRYLKEKDWQMLWKLRVKGKIKHFIWKGLHNCLPTCNVMQSRGCKVFNYCGLCGEEGESIEHLFFKCQKAQRIWKLSPVEWDGLRNYTESFSAWWSRLGCMKNLQKMESRVEITVYILWHIWKARNNWIFNKKMKTEWDIVHEAVEEWMEFENVNRCEKEKEINNRSKDEESYRWIRPEVGCVRINVGADSWNKEKRFGMGIIVHNEDANLMQAWSYAREGNYSPVAIELWAVRLALQLALQKGWRKVEVQLDTKAIVSKLNEESSPTLEVATIAEDIFLLRHNFNFCCFSWILSKYNKPCHVLAKMACESNNSKAWSDPFPAWLLSADQALIQPVGC